MFNDTFNFTEEEKAELARQAADQARADKYIEWLNQ